MRIGIDARLLGVGYGIGRYIEQLLLHLLPLDTVNQYVIFLRPGIYLPDTLETSRVQKVFTNIPWYSLQEQIQFSSIIHKQHVDLMHFPHWNIPLIYGRLFVVTIHDLTMFHYPRQDATTLSPGAYWLKDRVHRFVVIRVVKAARHIITTSEWTKHDLNKTLGVPLSKMTTIYQAPFFQNDKLGISHPPLAGQSEIATKFGIIQPYVLYVGAAYPHKNLPCLLTAWAKVIEKTGNSYQLVLVGKIDQFYKKLRESIRQSDKESISQLDIVFTDLVDDEMLSKLYTQASLFVYPSLSEGFGLPPLEALAHGVPVVASNRTSIPEILGKGALYVNSENIDELADSIILALRNKDIRFLMQKNGKHELTRYSWNKTAEKTLLIYNCQLSINGN